MFVRNLTFSIAAALLLSLGAGCKREPAPAAQSDSGSQNSLAKSHTTPATTNQNSKIGNQKSSSPLVRIHWLGKKRLAADTNAAYFMTIWNLPESARLEAQTLDKLALWLAGCRPAVSNYQEITNFSGLVASNTTSTLLRPVVFDMLQEEWLLEARQPTNQPFEFALAIRLDDQRTAAWQAAKDGLRDAIGSLRQKPCALTLTRSGNWTLLSLTDSTDSTGTNSILASFNTQLAATGNPFPPCPTNYWLQAEVEGSALAQALSLSSLPGPRPSAVSLAMVGEGESVRTRAEIEFPQPLKLELDPWIFPTNLIHDPLIGFTAVRGLRPWLKGFKPWNDLQVGTPPNQSFIWAQSGAPWLHFVALPSQEASNQVQRLQAFALNRLNPIFETNPIKLGEFEQEPGSSRLGWRGLPLISPSLDWSTADGQSFIVAGFYPKILTNAPLPPALLPQFYSSTNLICYDWEMTGPCLRGLTPITQLVRRLFNRPGLPAEPSISWLGAIPAKLANSATAIHSTSPTQVSFARSSTIGLSAAELVLLADWLQSPTFPCGLHTFEAPFIAQTAPAK